ncbi:hypothetical protein EDF56_11365 [Novosphingobium sp. PhB165]|nr:hypothetical protein EDF56_11365 [Novosphingobium sp. PhB165]
MVGQTSIGPAPSSGDGANNDSKNREIAEGVDAQKTSELEARGLKGGQTEATSSNDPAVQEQAEKQSDREASSSQEGRDSQRKDPNERSDMISERRHPGMHGGGGDVGRKPG